MARSIVRPMLVTAVLMLAAAALAEAPPAGAFAVVERYAQRISEGDFLAARVLFARDRLFVEHDLVLHVHAGAAVLPRVRAMLAAGTRLEIEPVSVSPDGTVVVVRERSWSDEVPEPLAPLRWTSVYHVLGDHIVSVNRVLDADQRDLLLRDLLIGGWSMYAAAFVFDADGTYQVGRTLADVHAGLVDHGTFELEASVLTLLSDSDSALCAPGDVAAFGLDVVDHERVTFIPARLDCTPLYGLAFAPGVGTAPVFRRFPDLR